MQSILKGLRIVEGSAFIAARAWGVGPADKPRERERRGEGE